MVLICISLMDTEVKHLRSFHVVICPPYILFGKIFLYVFCLISNWIFFLQLSFSVTMTIDYCPSSDH